MPLENVFENVVSIQQLAAKKLYGLMWNRLTSKEQSPVFANETIQHSVTKPQYAVFSFHFSGSSHTSRNMTSQTIPNTAKTTQKTSDA